MSLVFFLNLNGVYREDQKVDWQSENTGSYPISRCACRGHNFLFLRVINQVQIAGGCI